MATIILLAVSYVAFKNGDVFILAAGLTSVGEISPEVLIRDG